MTALAISSVVPCGIGSAACAWAFACAYSRSDTALSRSPDLPCGSSCREGLGLTTGIREDDATRP